MSNPQEIPKSTSKRSQNEISRKNQSTPPLSPRSNTSTPGSSPPRKIHQPSILEQEILQGDRNARNLTLAHNIAFDNNLKIGSSRSSHSLGLKSPSGSSLNNYSDLDSDNDYNLDSDNEGNGNEIQTNPILEKLQEVYWDKLQKQLSDEDDWNIILSPIQELKSSINELLPKRKITSIHVDLKEKIDLELIEQQIDADTFDLNSFKNITITIIDIMSKVCAPVRDDKIDALRQQLDKCKKHQICNLLDNIFKLVKLMNIDMANFSIKAIRPYIQKQQIEYERTKMSEYLSKNPEKGLEHSKEWLSIAFRQLKEEENKNFTGTDENANISPIGPNKVLDTAFYNLVSDPPSKFENFTFFWPETVLLDRDRIMLLHKIYNDLSILSAILFICNQILGKLKNKLSYTICKNLINNLKNEIFSILEGSTFKVTNDEIKIFSESVTNHVRKSFDYALVHASKTTTDESNVTCKELKLDLYFDQITEITSNKNHKIRLIFKNRILKYMKSVCDNTTNNMYKLSDQVESPNIPKPLLSINQHVAKLASSFTQLVILNKTIHGPFYSKLIKDIYEEYNREVKRLAEVDRAERIMNQKVQLTSGQSGSSSNENLSKQNNNTTQILFTPRKSNELNKLEKDEMNNSVNLVKKKLTFDELDLD